MSDKARGALFNMLGDLSGLTVLDPFAGSGALSFEAVSRGAAHATAIESDKAAQKVIASNIAKLGLDEQIKLIKANTGAWLQNNPEAQFDIILCDPPYSDLQPNLIKRLAQHVNSGGLLILSWPAGQTPLVFDDLDLLEHRHHGDATLAFYRRSR
jgi:16S rRNA (guanine966-N2)-methyltransferase